MFQHHESLALDTPRIQGPLWGLPGDANTGKTGMSDTMSPGSMSKLALSDDIAFRVRFTEPLPDAPWLMRIAKVTRVPEAEPLVHQRPATPQ